MALRAPWIPEDDSQMVHGTDVQENQLKFIASRRVGIYLNMGNAIHWHTMSCGVWDHKIPTCPSFTSLFVTKCNEGHNLISTSFALSRPSLWVTHNYIWAPPCTKQHKPVYSAKASPYARELSRQQNNSKVSGFANNHRHWKLILCQWYIPKAQVRQWYWMHMTWLMWLGTT